MAALYVLTRDSSVGSLYGVICLDRPRFLRPPTEPGPNHHRPIITALHGPEGVPAVADTIDMIAAVWP
jgi:hypothetical protein